MRLRLQATPTLVASHGPHRRYSYRSIAFELDRRGGTWFCFHGFQMDPDSMIATCHEAGWASWREKVVVRRVCRAIDAAFVEQEFEAMVA